jgi:hypothetical protein
LGIYIAVPINELADVSERKTGEDGAVELNSTG